MDVCRQLRADGTQVPVIMLTAKNDTIDVVVGLEVGADDYLTKPFEVRELLARVGAHLRRSEQAVAQAQPKTRFEFPGLIIDMNSRQVWREGKEVALTLTEFNLLSLLASQAGQVVSRGELLRKVWGYEVEIETRTVDAHVYRLRKKIERDSEKPHYVSRMVPSASICSVQPSETTTKSVSASRVMQLVRSGSDGIVRGAASSSAGTGDGTTPGGV
jgi:DNA-binding response OmpR family regulator